MIYTHIAAALISAAIASTGAWQVQSWRYGEQIASMKQVASEATTKAVKEAMAKMEVDQKRKDDALIESNKRAQKNAVAAANASNAVNGLRNELATARADLSKATQQARDNYAVAVETVLGECSRELAEMGRIADGHSSDVKMMLDAWPN
jgi:hypothetical protein